ncbi:MAG: hypothetical protein ACK4UO_06950 [Pseudolabrys sp.]
MTASWQGLLEVASAAALGATAFLFLRLYPIWPSRFRGCDAYNILLCAEYVRRERRLPPRVEGLFLLEDAAQWYPPLFFVLCAIVPQDWLQRRFWLFNQLVDLANAALLFVIATAVANAWFGAAAVIAYAMVAGLLQEFATLSTRPLGLLVMNLLMFSGYLASLDWRWMPLAVGSGVILIYAHKLSAQQAWFALPVLALVTGEWMWLALLPAMYAAAFLVWPSGFREVIRGHIVIVRFWARHWPLLGAHAVKQSPLYGDGRTRADFYGAWPNGAPLKFAKETLHQNYFVIPVLVSLTDWASVGPFEVMLLAWIGAVYLTAAVVHFWPALRGIGLGRQYVKFALLPSLVLCADMLAHTPMPLMLAAAFIAAALTLRQYWLVTLLLWRDDGAPSQHTSELERLLERVAADPAARIMALPYQLCDFVAYVTRQPIYWGTHAQVFDEKLAEFYPVLRRSIGDYAAEANLNYLLLDTRYAAPQDLRLDERQVVERAGPFALLRLEAAAHGQPLPAMSVSAQ